MGICNPAHLLLKRLDAILLSHNGYIQGLSDIVASQKPSVLFYIMGKKYGRLLSEDLDTESLKRNLKLRRMLHSVILKLLPYFMSKEQEIEFADDVRVPDEPVIWIANHGFKDDIAATLVAAKRHTYILFGSLPAFYNTIDGVAAYLNGVVLVNRKVRQSSHKSVDRAIEVLKNGTDLLIFPEGAWNKTPDKLILELWPGVFRIANSVGCKIVPVTHYLRDPDITYKENIIHTRVSKPVSLSGLTEREGIDLLRNILADNYYKLMETYGRSTRKELLGNCDNSDDAWDSYLQKHIGVTDRSAYMLIGTPDQVEHNPAMYAAWLNGMIFVDKDNPKSRKDSVEKMVRILNSGTSVIKYPEGAWNNTESLLVQPLFAGPWILAQRTGCEVVPVALYHEYKSKDVFYRANDPLILSDKDKKTALDELRDQMASLYYEMLLAHSSPLTRNALGAEPRLLYNEERMREYLCVHWTRDDWGMEITIYRDKTFPPVPEEVRASFDNVQLTAQNAAIMAPVLAERALDLKYDLVTYIKQNWRN